MDSFVNPPRRPQGEKRSSAEAERQKARQFPEQPERDVLLFLLEHAPLNAWQRDVPSASSARRRITSPLKDRPKS